MRTVKITDLKKLAQTAGSDEMLTLSQGDLFTTPLSTVLQDYATKVSLGNVQTSLGNLRVSLGNYKAEASDLFATKVSLGNVKASLGDYATKVSLGAVQVSLGNIQVSIATLNDRVTQVENFPPTPSNSISPVTWRNLTEINLSGEKLTNLDFLQSSYVQDSTYVFPANGTIFTDPKPRVISLDGQGGLTQDEIYEVERIRTTDGALKFFDLGGTDMGWHGIGLRGSRFEVVIKVPDDWEVNGGTLDQAKIENGIIKGSGSAVSLNYTFSNPIPINTDLVAKADATGDVAITLLKQNGTAYSPSVTIPQSDGFAKVTTSGDVYGIRLSTSHGSREINSVSLFQGDVAGGSVLVTNGAIQKISGTDAWNAGASSVEYIEGSSDGYVQFQFGQGTKSVRIGLTYEDEDYDVQDFMWSTVSNGYNNQPSGDPNHPDLVGGEWFRIRHYANNNRVEFQRKQKIYGQNNVVLGEDFITYHTATSTTDGRNLYVDVSLFHIGSQLNDVSIVTA